MDINDSNFSIFLSHFIATLRKIYPEACQETYKLFHSDNHLARQSIPLVLTNEISALPDSFILVLDDFHRANCPDLNELVSGWIRHWPVPMHMVIISRKQPSLPLAGLKSKGALTEIRSKDLRFSPEESANYIRMATNRDLRENNLYKLLDQIEGWVAGLKLLSLAIHEAPLEQSVSTLLSRGKTDLFNYLVDEVISHMTPGMQKALMKMSILDFFSPSLGRSLLDSDDIDDSVAHFLDNLSKTDLFITVLDAQKEEFRFHHLLRNIMHERLMKSISPEQVRMLHLRAATLYAEANQTNRAFEHAIKAGSSKLFTRVAWQKSREALNSDDRSCLRYLIKRMTEEEIRVEPLQLLLSAWLKVADWDIEGIKAIIGQLEAMMKNGTQLHKNDQDHVFGQIAVLKAIVAFNANEHIRAIKLCTKALQLLPTNWGYVRGQAVFYLGLSMQSCKGLPEASAYLQQIYQVSNKEDYSYILRHLFSLSLIHLQDGDFITSEHYALLLIDKARFSNHVQLEGFALALLGTVNYQWNKLDLAEKWYQELYSMRFLTIYVPARHGYIGLALTLQALAKGDEALKVIDELCKLEIELIGQVTGWTKATRLRLLTKSGLRSEAEKWAEDYNKPFPYAPIIYDFEEPLVFKARFLIARNQRKDDHLVRDILSSYEKITRETNNTWAMAESFALQALFEMNTGHKTAARDLLIKSLELASKGNLIRLYVDLGPQMYELLQQVDGIKENASFIKELLTAFTGAKTDLSLINNHSDKQSALDTAALEQPLYENLTLRELEVLCLLAEAVSLQEIADRLYIAYATAKRHTINIYSKLGVHNRWEAVAFAKKNGII